MILSECIKFGDGWKVNFNADKGIYLISIENENNTETHRVIIN